MTGCSMSRIPAASGARGFNRGAIYTREGVLVGKREAEAVQR